MSMLNKRQRVELKHIEFFGVHAPYGASEFRTVDALVRRNLAEWVEGPNRWGETTTGVKLTEAGRQCLAQQ